MLPESFFDNSCLLHVERPSSRSFAAGRVTQIDHHQGSSGSGDRIDGYDLVWNSRNLLEQFNFIPTTYAGESATYAYDPRGQLVGTTTPHRPMKRTISTPTAIARRSPMTAIPAAWRMRPGMTTG